MKIPIQKPTTVDVTHVLIDVPIHHGEEEIPNNFPLRDGDRWRAKIDLETGAIENWPANTVAEVFLTVRDSGTYKLLGPDGKEVAVISNDYVPNRVVPGEYGDTIEFGVEGDGRIAGWMTPKPQDFARFFGAKDDS